jgi:hypothetical protein
METEASRVVQVTITLERADGTKRTYAVKELPDHGPVLGEFTWNREPVEDVEAMTRTGWMYKCMKPGPLLDLTVRASGAFVDAE